MLLRYAICSARTSWYYAAYSAYIYKYKICMFVCFLVVIVLSHAG